MASGIGLLDKLFSGKDGKSIVESVTDGIGSIIDKYHVSPEDKMAMQAEMDKVLEERRQFAIQMIQADNADTDSARKMNTAIQGDKPSWLAKNVAYLIAISILGVWGAFTGYLSLSMMKYIHVEEKIDYTGLLAIYGTVTSLATAIVGYYFGSSHSSVEKQKTIDRLTS